MSTIVHLTHGEPADVLRTIDRSPPTVAPAGSALVRVALAPIHPGDLQAIAASPTFGDPVEIPDDGRVPGLEGVGTVTALAEDVDPALGLRVGTRVAFFPVAGTWTDTVVAPVGSLVVLPDEIPGDIAAHLLIDAVTAALVVRSGHNALPEDSRVDVTVIQTGAGSAVGRLITADLIRRGVQSIRLVRSAQSAAHLGALLPGGPVVATDAPDWREQVRAAIGDDAVQVAFDGVGGPLLGDLVTFLRPGGTVISYGSLGGAAADIRGLLPRGLTLKGVSIMSWFGEPDAARRADLRFALKLAQDDPAQFVTAAIYRPDDVTAAVTHVEKPGRSGSVLIDFRDPATGDMR
jgi:NADPH:quinone reductase